MQHAQILGQSILITFYDFQSSALICSIRSLSLNTFVTIDRFVLFVLQDLEIPQVFFSSLSFPFFFLKVNLIDQIRLNLKLIQIT